MTTGISFSGLASGLDTGAIIDALVGVARLPIVRLEGKKKDYNSKMSLISDLSTKLGVVGSAAKDLDTSSEFKSFAASSSDEDCFTATAGGTAAQGTYAVTVSALCQAERTYSDAIDERDQAGLFGTGTLTMRVGDDPLDNINLTIDGTDTLETVAGKINNQVEGVTASVIYEGPLTDAYRIVVVGDNSGADYNIEITESAGLTLNLDDTLNNQMQAATNAAFTIDGIPMSSASNTVTGVVVGVTLDLLTTTTQTETLSVDIDKEAIEEKITALLDGYNEVTGFLARQFTYSGEVKTNTLMGDTAARSVQSRLRTILFGEVSALPDQYNALVRVGISSSEGKLSLDSTKFKTALSDDFEAVADLFTYTDGDDDTDNDGIAVRLQRTIKAMLQDPGGLLPNREDALEDQVEDIDGMVERLERNMETYEDGLRRQFAALEATLSQLNSQSSFLSSQGY
jgi:flagellar hook-associated protein 2